MGLQTEDGNQAIGIVTAADPVDKTYVAAWEDRDYRLWIGRNRGGGYASIFDRVLKEVE